MSPAPHLIPVLLLASLNCAGRSLGSCSEQSGGTSEEAASPPLHTSKLRECKTTRALRVHCPKKRLVFAARNYRRNRNTNCAVSQLRNKFVCATKARKPPTGSAAENVIAQRARDTDTQTRAPHIVVYLLRFYFTVTRFRSGNLSAGDRTCEPIAARDKRVEVA